MKVKERRKKTTNIVRQKEEEGKYINENGYKGEEEPKQFGRAEASKGRRITSLISLNVSQKAVSFTKFSSFRTHFLYDTH